MKELYEIWNDLRCSCETYLSFKDWCIQHQDQSNIDEYDNTENNQDFFEENINFKELELIH